MKNEASSKKTVRPVDSTPIYLTSRQICARSAKIAARMPVNYRHTTGSMLLTRSMELSMAIIRAYKETRDMARKCELTSKIEFACDEVLILLRIAHDNNVITRQDFAEQVDDCASIIKQATGWLRALRGEQGTKRPEHTPRNDAGMACRQLGRNAQ